MMPILQTRSDIVNAFRIDLKERTEAWLRNADTSWLGEEAYLHLDISKWTEDLKSIQTIHESSLRRYGTPSAYTDSIEELSLRVEVAATRLAELTGVANASLRIVKKIRRGDQGGLSMNDIALIHYYNLEHVTRANAAEIAAKYGFVAVNSGKKFLQNYGAWTDKTLRSGISELPADGSQTVNINKVKRIRKILPYLTSNKALAWATEEANTLEANIENLPS